MQLGMIGLGRMGGNIVRRLMRQGHSCAVFDTNAQSVAQLAKEGASPATDLHHLVQQLQKPRAVWVMLPAGEITEATVKALHDLLEPGDIVIDGGNSNYQDDVRRAQSLSVKGIRYMDVGTSGGVWGLERGYCMMIGGDKDAFAHLDPIFKSLAPGVGNIEKTPGRQDRQSTAEEGYLYTGPAGSGHFVKMVHNGIEYGMMQAYAEGLDIIRGANAGKHVRDNDAETAPLRNPEHYMYEIDLASVTQVWRRGSVVGSWLLDLTAAALASDPKLEQFGGKVSDSGEGRWTLAAANEEGVPAPVLTAALFARFNSRGNGNFANQVLSAQRFAFGGHLEKKD